MNQGNQELEVKFYLADLKAFEQRLQQAGAVLQQPRTRETNLRFDKRGGELTRARRVLRLRQDERARLTYKGPADPRRRVSVRDEIEFEVSSFENARAFLEALGFVVSVMYEKYRTTYHLDGVEVVLDELPYGNFAEIEGLDEDAIQGLAEKLGLKWEARVLDSYLGLFSRLCLNERLDIKNLTFREVPRPYPPDSLGVAAGDA